MAVAVTSSHTLGSFDTTQLPYPAALQPEADPVGQPGCQHGVSLLQGTEGPFLYPFPFCGVICEPGANWKMSHIRVCVCVRV